MSLPDNPADLKRIKGMGQKTVEKYGDELVAMVRAYLKHPASKEEIND
jgi:superfamily II DNA helicase RecQ